MCRCHIRIGVQGGIIIIGMDIDRLELDIRVTGGLELSRAFWYFWDGKGLKDGV